MEIQEVVPATILVIDGEVCGVVLTVDPALGNLENIGGRYRSAA